MAFVLAALVFIAATLISILVLFGDAMSDVTGRGGTDAFWVFGVGIAITFLIAGSHWVHIGW